MSQMTKRALVASLKELMAEKPLDKITVTDLTEQQRRAVTRTYSRLARSGPKLMLTTYFGGLGDNLSLVTALPVAGLHVDLVRAPDPRCSYDRVLHCNPATSRCEMDRPTPDCSDYKAP